MPFQQFQLTKSVNQSRGIFDKYIYKPLSNDLIADILVSGYFDESRYSSDPDWIGGIIEISASDGFAIGRVVDGGIITLYDSTGAGSVNVEWGAITGDINAQTDLQQQLAEITLDNIIVVNKLSDIPDQDVTTWTAKAGTAYVFGALISTSKQVIMEDGSALIGNSVLNLVYTYTGTGSMIKCDNAGFELRNFGFSAPNGSVFAVTDGLPIVINFARCFDCDKIGFITTSVGITAINMFDTAFLNVKTQGLQLSGDVQLFSVREVFMVTTSTGVNLIDWSGSMMNDMEITNLEGFAPAGSFVLSGDAGSINMSGGRVGVIRDSSLSSRALNNSLGGGLSADDTGYSFANSTVIDSKVIGHCYVTTPQVTAVSPGVEVRVAGLFVNGTETSQATTTSDGIIITRNRIEKRGTASVDVDVDKAGGGVDGYIFRVKKIPISTGVIESVDGLFTAREIAGGGTDNFSISGPVRFMDGDQFYVSVESVATNDNITAFTQGFEVYE